MVAIVITDLTRMSGRKVCIAGYTKDLVCIRPLLDDRDKVNEDWIQKNDQLIIKPFAEIKFTNVQQMNSPSPHIEDHLVNPEYELVNILREKEEKQDLLNETLFSSVKAIFNTTIYTDHGFYVKKHTGDRSLGTIIPANIQRINYGPKTYGNKTKMGYRILFEDNLQDKYNLRVTDLAFRKYLNSQIPSDTSEDEKIYSKISRDIEGKLKNSEELFFRIGLARGWNPEPNQIWDRCYLQITGIYSFPDYLGGKNYLDF